MKWYGVSLILSALFPSAVCAATDPFVGTWTLNVQKSKYPPGAVPKSMVIRMESTSKGIRYRSETTNANGKRSKAEYVADYSGKEAIVIGTAGIMAPVSLKRLNPRTVVASYLRGQQVVATSRRVISKDGRVMTITTTSKDKNGKDVINVGIYERATRVAASAE